MSHQTQAQIPYYSSCRVEPVMVPGQGFESAGRARA